DDLEHQDVFERIQALATGSGCRPNRWSYQVGASPIVELAVGDSGSCTRGRAAIAHRVVLAQAWLREQGTLLRCFDTHLVSHPALPPAKTRPRIETRHRIARWVFTEGRPLPQGGSTRPAACRRNSNLNLRS